MLDSRNLSIAFLVVVALVLAGIGTGVFTRGVAPAPGMSAPVAGPPAPGPAAPPAPATPAAPVTPSTAPAGLDVKPGDSVDGTFIMQSERCDAPCPVFTRTVTTLVFRLTVEAGNQVRIVFGPSLDALDRTVALTGTLDPATGRMSGAYTGVPEGLFGRWSGVLARRQGRLEAEGQHCMGFAESSPYRPFNRKLGGHFWSPATRTAPTLPDRDTSCGPDDPSKAGVPTAP
jgi:hypothetical protein